MSQVWWRETWKEAIYRSALKPSERLIAFVYADHARDQRTAWVTLDRLVEVTGMSRTQAQSWRSRVVKSGFLVEVSKATHHRATVYGLVIPDAEGAGESAPSGCRDVGTQEDDRVPEIEGQGAGNVESGCRGVGTNQSLINPTSISLSSEQALVRDLLGLDDGDERLMKISSILQANNVRAPKPWLRKCHENGEILDLLQAESKTTSWAEPEDDGTMPNPGYIDGWGTPERIRVEDYYKGRIVGLGYTEEEASVYLNKAIDIYPTGSERKCWSEAYMTARNDATNCGECGWNRTNHSPICSEAPEQQTA